MFVRNFVVYGCADRPIEPLQLRAGPLTMLFEPQTAFLRRIRFGPTELVRGVYAAVRDRNWGTVPPKISNLRSQISEDAFRLTFRVECRQGEIDFHWHGSVTGTPDGTVNFGFDGEARSTFLRNRIGICVLHPLAGCAGQPCEVVHTDDTLEHGVFPQSISPHQPFKRIRAIRHAARPGLQVEVLFEGEVFEMEDQRNWTDASFKTYGTPLELPFPAHILKGTRIQQKVTVGLRDEPRNSKVPPPERMDEVTSSESRHEPHALTSFLSVTGQVGARKPGEGMVEETNARTRLGRVQYCDPMAAELKIPASSTLTMPPLGLSMASHGQALTEREARRLRLLRLSHLRAELDFSKPGWRDALRRAAQAASQTGCTLHLALLLTDDATAELNLLAAEMEPLHPPVSLWQVFHVSEAATGEKWVRRAKETLARFGEDIPIAAGTNANFAELNRHRPLPDSTALPCFALNPQVHAFDNLSLVENLEVQASTVETVRQFSRHPVVISPITLRPRLNAVATGETTPPAADQLPTQVDPRQLSLIGAAWTLGSIANLGSTGHVHSLTYYETTGWRGVMEVEAGSPLPREFPSFPGAVFPLFLVLASLAGFTRLAPIAASVPDILATLTLFDGKRRRLLLANLTSQVQLVRLPDASAPRRCRVLDENNVELALREPEAFLAGSRAEFIGPSDCHRLSLKPYAFVCLDMA